MQCKTVLPALATEHPMYTSSVMSSGLLELFSWTFVDRIAVCSPRNNVLGETIKLNSWTGVLVEARSNVGCPAVRSQCVFSDVAGRQKMITVDRKSVTE